MDMISSIARAWYPTTSQDTDSRTVYRVINIIFKMDTGIYGSIMGASLRLMFRVR